MSTPQSDHHDPATLVIEKLHFPECLRWHDDRLFFVDMYGDAVFVFDPAGGSRALQKVADVFHPGGIGWLPDGRMLGVASEDRQILEIGGPENSLYADLGEVSPGWVNDILVDSDGRVIAGNFGYDLFADDPRPTGLIIVDTDGTAVMQPDELVFPNGMVKRSDGKLVVAESFGRCLTTFAITDDGNLRKESSLALGDITPDGMCIDAEDHIWLTTVSTPEVVRVSPEGDLERREVSQPSYACMLGGEDRRTLYVATAPDFEPADRRARAEGRIEALRVQVPGTGQQGLGI